MLALKEDTYVDDLQEVEKRKKNLSGSKMNYHKL